MGCPISSRTKTHITTHRLNKHPRKHNRHKRALNPILIHPPLTLIMVRIHRSVRWYPAVLGGPVARIFACGLSGWGGMGIERCVVVGGVV